jgi:putative phosphoribosyl transferase
MELDVSNASDRNRNGKDLPGSVSKKGPLSGMNALFQNRRQAGRHLAARLEEYANRSDVLVLALPRGGVPVGFELAKSLRAPLDVIIVRKLGVPGQEELAMGAIAAGGVRILNNEVVRHLGIPEAVIAAVASAEQKELERRDQMYRDSRPLPALRERTVILVDDGLATGSTMRAAIAVVRQQHPARIVVAVPVGAASTCEEFRLEVDRIVCGLTPEPFYGVGEWYEDFSQTTDQEVRELLQVASQSQAGSTP